MKAQVRYYLLSLLALAGLAAHAQVPAVSYSSPQTYGVGITIAPLAPASSGVAVVGYGSQNTLSSGFSNAMGVAVDAAGNVYAADYGNNTVKKLPAGGGAAVNIGSGFHYPSDVAVDAAGNVYVADNGNYAVKEIPAGGGAMVTLASGIYDLSGVAVDKAGNVFVTDGSNVEEIHPGSGIAKTYRTGFTGAAGICVDAAGNVYVTDYDKDVVKEIPAGGGATVTLASGLDNPKFIAIDAAGNLYVSDSYNNSIYELPAGGGPAVTLASVTDPRGVAVDAAGNLYVASLYTVIYKYKPVGGYYINAALPAGLNFDENTGTISGTPTALSPATNYTVTAYNNSGSASATVNIKVLGSNNANLSALQTSTGTLSPSFASGTTDYTANVPADIASVTVTPTTAFAKATVTVNGTAVVSGTASAAIPLAYGSNTIAAVVTAQDKTTTKTYTLTVTRAPLTTLNNAHLAALSLSSGTLSPVFAEETTGYTATVGSSVTSIVVTPTASQAQATITVNGQAVISGTASPGIPLAVGPNIITTVVTAQDGITTRTYTVVVTRLSANANLASLSLNGGSVALSPAFAFNTLNYTAIVPESIVSVTVRPSAQQANATVTVNGVAVASSAVSAPIPISEGANNISIVVTAQDGVTTETYTVTVNQEGPAYLSNLQLSAGKLSPAFAAATTNYAAFIGVNATSLTVTPTAADPSYTITVNGAAVVSGNPSAPIPLSKGPNTITIVVSGNDVRTTTYTLIAGAGYDDGYMGYLMIDDGAVALSPSFAFKNLDYSASVGNGITSVTVTPLLLNNNATVTVNGTAVSSGTASAPVALNVGANNIAVVGRAQDGITYQTYNITVTRAASPNAYLSNLYAFRRQPELSPAFDFKTFGYTMNVANSFSSIVLYPSAFEADATIKINGTPVTPGPSQPSIPLAIGQNTINIVVTAPDGVTTQTYTITVTRAAGADDSFNQAISVSSPNNDALFTIEGIKVHQGVSPNGDGIDDVFTIDNITNYPDNKLAIMDRNGSVIYQQKSYDNVTKAFDGHSNVTGKMQLPGTYFYALEYVVKGVTMRKTGFIVLKY